MATYYVKAGIQNADGSEGTGRTVTCNIYDCHDATWDVEGAAMTEVGKGAYMYPFAGYDPSHDYICRADVAGVSGWIKYAWSEIEAKNHAASQVRTELTTELSSIEFIKAIEGGRWKIDSALNQMIFFEDDNVTEVARFNLRNKSGAAASENIYERTRA